MNVMRTIKHKLGFGPNEQVHKIKNQFAAKESQMHMQKHKLREELRQDSETLKQIAYRVGVAAGRIQ